MKKVAKFVAVKAKEGDLLHIRYFDLTYHAVEDLINGWIRECEKRGWTVELRDFEIGTCCGRCNGKTENPVSDSSR